MAQLDSIIKKLENCMRYDTGVTEHTARITQISWILFLRIYDAKEKEWEIRDDNYVSIIPDKYKWRSWAKDDKSGKALTGDDLLEFVNKDLFPGLASIPIDKDTPLRQAILVEAFQGLKNNMVNGIELRKVINIIDGIDFNKSDDRHYFNDIYQNLIEKMRSQKSSGEYYTPRAVTNFIVDTVNPRLGERVADFACGTGGFLSSTLVHLEKQKKSTEDLKKFGDSIYGTELMTMPYILSVTNMILHDVDNPRIHHGDSLMKNVYDYKEEDKFEVILMNPPFGGTLPEGCKGNFPMELQSGETSDLFVILIMYRLKKNGRAAVILPPGFLFATEGAPMRIKKELMSKFNLHTIIRLPKDVFQPYTTTQTNILFFDNTGPTKETWIYRMDYPEGYKHFSKTKPITNEHLDVVRSWLSDKKEIYEPETETYKAKCFTLKEISAADYDLDLCGFPQEIIEILPPDEVIKNYREERDALTAKIDSVLNEIESILDGAKNA